MPHQKHAHAHGPAWLFSPTQPGPCSYPMLFSHLFTVNIRQLNKIIFLFNFQIAKKPCISTVFRVSPKMNKEKSPLWAIQCISYSFRICPIYCTPDIFEPFPYVKYLHFTHKAEPNIACPSSKNTLHFFNRTKHPDYMLIALIKSH